MTVHYLGLRVCERFGLHPETWDSMAEGLRVTLLDYDAVRSAEEHRERKQLIEAVVCNATA